MSPARKKTSRKPTSRKTAPRPAPSRKAAPRKASPRKARPRKRASKREAPPPLAPSEPRSRLGAKYVCFECDAKFYDLNKPEPICPKCGADQRKRRKRPADSKPAAAPRARKPERSMAPLLEEEDDVVVLEDGEVELGVAPEAALLGEDADTEDEEEPEEP